MGRGYKSILVFLRASEGKGTVLFVPFGNKGVMLGEVNESGPLVFDAKEISLGGRAGFTNWNVMLDEETNQGFLLNWFKGNGLGKNKPSECNNMEIYSLDLNKRKIRLEESIDGEEYMNIWAIGEKGAAISSRWDKKSYLYLVSVKSKEVKKIKTVAYLSSLDRNVVTDSEIHSIPYSGEIKVLDLLTGEPKPPLPNPGKRGGQDLPYKLEHKQIPNDPYYDFDFKPDPGLGLKAGHWRSFADGATIVNIKQGYLYICPSGFQKKPGVVVDLFQTPQMEKLPDYVTWTQFLVAPGKYIANNPSGSMHTFYKKEGYKPILSGIIQYRKLDEEKLIVKTENGEGIIDHDGKYKMEPFNGSLESHQTYLIKKEVGKAVEVLDMATLVSLGTFEEVNFSWTDYPAVKRNGKWTIMDLKNQKPIVEGQFDRIESAAGLVLCFSGEKANAFAGKKLENPIVVNGVKGLTAINQNFASIQTTIGIRIWIAGSKSFSEISNYQSAEGLSKTTDFCRVKSGAGFGLIHKSSSTGKEELSGFDSIASYSGSTIILKKSGKYGLFSGMGKPLMLFSSILSYDEKTNFIIAKTPLGTNAYKFGSETPELNQYYGFVEHIKDEYFKVGDRPNSKIGLVWRNELMVPIGFDDISLPYKINQEQIDVKIGKEPIVYNVKKKRAEKKCKKCNGYGEVEYVVETKESCSNCFGKGWFQETRFDSKTQRMAEYAVDCSKCNRSGKITTKNKRSNPCAECEQGWIKVSF